jgi:hypothetical protein
MSPHIGPKTTVSVSFVAGLFTALVPAALYVSSVVAKAAVFEQRVLALEETTSNINYIRQDVSVMKGQLDLLIKTVYRLGHNDPPERP